MCSCERNYSKFALPLGEGQQINAHFLFISNASRCIHMRYQPRSLGLSSSCSLSLQGAGRGEILGTRLMRYAIPFIIIPYMFWVSMMPKFRIVKEKEKQEDIIKRPQQNVSFFSIKAYVIKSDTEYFRVPGLKTELVNINSSGWTGFHTQLFFIWRQLLQTNQRCCNGNQNGTYNPRQNCWDN